jgi:hypothetical protein
VSTRRIRFVGGVWDGIREVEKPLPPEIVVAVATYKQMRMAADKIPLNVLHPTDTYRLETYMDHTGIPEKRYRLRAMTR